MVKSQRTTRRLPQVLPPAGGRCHDQSFNSAGARHANASASADSLDEVLARRLRRSPRLSRPSARRPIRRPCTGRGYRRGSASTRFCAFVAARSSPSCRQGRGSTKLGLANGLGSVLDLMVHDRAFQSQPCRKTAIVRSSCGLKPAYSSSLSYQPARLAKRALGKLGQPCLSASSSRNDRGPVQVDSINEPVPAVARTVTRTLESHRRTHPLLECHRAAASWVCN